MHKEIIEQFTSRGINPPPHIELDGKLKRWPHDERDKRKSAWMVGFNNITSKGENFCVAVGGTLREGNEPLFKYQSNGVTLDKHDKKRINEEIKKAQDQYEREKQRVQEDVARECEQLANRAEVDWGLVDCEYLKNKRITKECLSGIWYEKGIGGGRLFIPMRDCEEKLWGFQRIFDSGDKRFLKGQRITGCFHTIGANVKLAPEIYICEGFATGASIHEATKKTVVVAFNAGNLRPVAQALFEKYPDKAYIICGDDDKYHEDGINPGRDKATEAADACVGKTIFPSFENVETKPTDFNDLHCLEGLDKVRSIILDVKPEAHFINCLGYNEKKYYIFSNENLQVQEFTPSELGTQMGLCRIQPSHYWENLYPGQRGGTRWGDAGADLMESCHKKGIFRTDMIRGPGAWLDENRPVFHAGDSIFFTGRYFDLNDKFKSRFMYEFAESKARLDAEPLTDQEAEEFLEAVSNASWKKESNGAVLAAWLALAPVSGALDWRPHVWLTGPAGTGKSWLMEHVCNKILRGYATFAQGQTTEAGLRQNQRSSSLPIIFDEFETNDEHSSTRVKMILELARQASSDSSAVVFKGTSSGDPLQFRPRFSMLVSSVRVNLIHEEDSSRFTLIEMDRNAKVGNFPLLENWAAVKSDDFGQRLARRSFDLLPSIIHNARLFQKVIGRKYSMRFGQQWGTLAAGIVSLCFGNKKFEETEAESYVTESLEELGLFEDASPQKQDRDEQSCLDRLLNSFIEIVNFQGDKEKLPVLRIIRQIQDGKDYSDQLEDYGVKVEKDFIFVISRYEQLQKIYTGTKWAGGYSKALARIEGAIPNINKWFKTQECTRRCVQIPIPAKI